MSEPDTEISVRVNNIDYVVASPGPMDDPEELTRVPVLRIYGTSSTGAKACVHVHQVYPYFYIEYAGSLDPDSGVFATLPLRAKQNIELTASMTVKSQPLHCKASYFAQPRSCTLPKPEQIHIRFTLHPRDHPCQGNPLLRLPLWVFSLS